MSESTRKYTLILRFSTYTQHTEIAGTPSWLRHCATSRKVAGSIPDGVIGVFHWHNPSGSTIAPESTQYLTEKVPGIFPEGKGGRCVGLTTLPHSCGNCHEIWWPQPPGNIRARPALYRDCFTFTLLVNCVFQTWPDLNCQCNTLAVAVRTPGIFVIFRTEIDDSEVE